MYGIYMNNNCVGQADVIKEGLYYRFVCTCTPPNRELHRIRVNDGRKTRDLGICVPLGEVFTLTARVPIKELSDGNFSFELVGKTSYGIPVADDTPFEDLDKLETARLHCEDGQSFIIID